MSSSETTFNDEPFYIRIVGETEHEDGSATYSFDLDQNAQSGLTKLGLELSLYCAASKVDIQEVFDYILWLGKSREMEQDE